MAWKTVDMELFTKQLMDVLKDFANVEAEVLERESDKVSKEAVKLIKKTSPKSKKKQDTHTYAEGWTRQKNKRGNLYEYTLYNASKPGLTHLLEKGHAVKPEPEDPDRKKRVEGKPHIKPAEEWASHELISRLEKKL